MSDPGALVGLRTQDHKSLCTPVMICATMVVSKCFLSILTPVTQLFIPVRCIHDANLVTAGQLLAEIMQILAFSINNVLKVGHGDLLFGVQRLFTSMSLCA